MRDKGRPRGRTAATASDLLSGVELSRNGWHFLADGSVFVVMPRKNGEPRRVYGAVSRCVKCGKEYFQRTQNINRGPGHPGIYCSKSCSMRGRRMHREWIEKVKRSKNRTFRKRGVKTVTVDALAGRLCRARGKCEAQEDGRVCGGPFHWAHIISRSYRRVRWDSDNCLCLCRDHHMFYTHRPIEWENFVVQKLGAEKYAELRRRAIDTGPKLNPQDTYEVLLTLAERSGLR